jgi:hypothetical protein
MEGSRVILPSKYNFAKGSKSRKNYLKERGVKCTYSARGLRLVDVASLPGYCSFVTLCRQCL